MSKIVVTVTMRLLSDTIFSSGGSVPGGEDIALRVDGKGRPFLPGSTLKGLFRESMENYLSWIGQDSGILEELLGKGGQMEEESPRRVIFSDLWPENPPEDSSEWSSFRAFTALEDGVVKAQTLRTAACLNSGLCFSGMLLCQEADYVWISDALRGIQWVGLLRNRGFGHVRITARKQSQLEPLPPVSRSRTLRYRLRAVTPVSIPWLSKSGVSFTDERNFTESRSYVPGGAVRGMVLSCLARQEPQWFAEHKNALLRQVCFHNALPMDGSHSVIPTPMGFYDEKNGRNPYSVLFQDVQPGHKRVGLGRFCYAENGIIHGSTPEMISTMRIRRGEDKKVFTTRAMGVGTVLEGYITLEDPALAEMVCRAFSRYVWLGADRYAGNGLCQVTLLDAGAPDTAGYGFRREDPIPKRLHMLLLSPMTMCRNGEPCGIDEARLAELLGIPSVKLGRSATSITEMAGFNRTWGCAAPAVTMYEAGSVFTLECGEAPTWEALHALEQTGLGIRGNEGCGRVLFVKDFEKQFAGLPEEKTCEAAVSRSALLRQARCGWLLEHPLKTSLSPSQIGDMQAICEAIMAGTKSLPDLEEHFRHNREDRGTRHGEGYQQLYPEFQKIWSTPLSQTLGVENCPDSQTERLRLLCDWMNLSRKEGSRQ